jgi:anti-sigma factor RsiW
MSETSTSCTAEPVSWLLLEQLALGELDPVRQRAIEAHLAGCAACRAARDHIEADRARPLAPLPELAVARARRRAPRRVAVAAATLAAAAALLLFIRDRRAPDPSPDPSRGGAKGGELAVGLVRDRGGEVTLDPTGFRPGDRFKVLVTCVSAGEVDVDVAVLQAGATFHPLERARLRCGNQVPLPGAFRLTGDQPAAICAIVGGQRACADLAPERAD